MEFKDDQATVSSSTLKPRYNVITLVVRVLIRLFRS